MDLSSLRARGWSLPKQVGPLFASLRRPLIATGDRRPHNSARQFDPYQRRILFAKLRDLQKGNAMLMQSVGRPIGSFLSNFLDRAKCAISRWWEVSRLDPQEIETVARDLNVSSAELVALMFTSSESLDSLGRRLAYAGVPQETLAVSHPAELRDMRRICSQCSSKARCARDLRHKRMATPSKYCPNEPTLRALALETHRAQTVEARGVPASLS
jgi:hypothetical protein